MTTVVAAVDAGKVYMAADSQSTDENYYADYSCEKIWYVGDAIFGGAGKIRPLLALRYMDAELLEHDESDESFMFLRFPTIVENYLADSDVGEDQYELAIGLHGVLYYFSGNDVECSWGGRYLAIGSGASFARGTMYATEIMTTPDRVELAINAAKHFDTQTGGDIWTGEI